MLQYLYFTVVFMDTIQCVSLFFVSWCVVLHGLSLPYLTFGMGRLLHLGYEAKIGVNAKNSPVT